MLCSWFIVFINMLKTSCKSFILLLAIGCPRCQEVHDIVIVFFNLILNLCFVYIQTSNIFVPNFKIIFHWRKIKGFCNNTFEINIKFILNNWLQNVYKGFHSSNTFDFVAHRR